MMGLLSRRPGGDKMCGLKELLVSCTIIDGRTYVMALIS